MISGQNNLFCLKIIKSPDKVYETLKVLFYLPNWSLCHHNKFKLLCRKCDSRTYLRYIFTMGKKKGKVIILLRSLAGKLNITKPYYWWFFILIYGDFIETNIEMSLRILKSISCIDTDKKKWHGHADTWRCINCLSAVQWPNMIS